MANVLYTERTTPLAINSANSTFSSGLNLAWDFTAFDPPRVDGVPWLYVGATSPTLVKTGTMSSVTLAGELCRLSAGTANYDYTNTADYGWQTGSGDFLIGIKVSTPSTAPNTAQLEALRISGASGTALSVIILEDSGVGWYAAISGSAAIAAGTQQAATIFPSNTSFMVWIVRASNVVTIYTQNITTQAAPVVRNSAATCTASMDSGWAARTVLNFSSSGTTTCGLSTVLHWNVAKNLTDMTAIGKDIWNTQANAPAPTPVSFSGPVPTRNGVVGSAASFSNAGFFAGSLTPFAYTLQSGTLPAGLTLSSSTGIISGTPTTAGTSSGIIIRATDTASNTASTNSYSIVIAATNASPTFPGSIANITGTNGVAITPVNVSGQFSDTDALTYTASPAGTAWPSGLIVNSSTGIISGTVATSTTTGLKVRATDTASQTVDSNAFNATISSATTVAFNFVAPGHVLGRSDSGALRTGLSTHVFVQDKATGALLATKTGQSTHATTALPSNFTLSGLAAGSYKVDVVNDADSNDYASFIMNAV